MRGFQVRVLGAQPNKKPSHRFQCEGKEVENKNLYYFFAFFLAFLAIALPFPASDSAIAIAWAGGRPSFLSFRMLAEIASFDRPLFSGMVPPAP